MLALVFLVLFLALRQDQLPLVMAVAAVAAVAGGVDDTFVVLLFVVGVIVGVG